MSYIDVTLPMHAGMLTFPGDPPFGTFTYRTVDPVDPESYRLTLLSCGTHCGTHVDAPAHFVAGGPGVDAIPLPVLCGLARVADLRGAGPEISAQTLRGLALEGVERLLLRTSSGLDTSQTPSTHLTVDAAAYLVDETVVRLVGIDVLSVDAPGGRGYPVHHTLLGASPPRVIVEGLDLRTVPAGDYELWCLPLRLTGADGSPARVILRPV